MADLAARHAQALEGLRACHLMDKMPVDIKQAGAILGLMDQVVVPDLVIKCARLGHGNRPNCLNTGYLAAQSRKAKGFCRILKLPCWHGFLHAMIDRRTAISGLLGKAEPVPGFDDVHFANWDCSSFSLFRNDLSNVPEDLLACACEVSSTDGLWCFAQQRGMFAFAGPVLCSILGDVLQDKACTGDRTSRHAYR